MQLSEMFRRGVVVPLDDDGALALESGDVNDSVRVRLVHIADQNEFDLIWETGFFSSINQETGSLIDDHEEQVIPAEAVSQVRALAASFAQRRKGGDTGKRFFDAILDACDVALAGERPLYFVL